MMKLRGREGEDYLFGGSGDDLLDGGAGWKEAVGVPEPIPALNVEQIFDCSSMRNKATRDAARMLSRLTRSRSRLPTRVGFWMATSLGRPTLPTWHASCGTPTRTCARVSAVWTLPGRSGSLS